MSALILVMGGIALYIFIGMFCLVTVFYATLSQDKSEIEFVVLWPYYLVREVWHWLVLLHRKD